MNNKIFSKKFWLVVVFSLTIALQSTDAFAHSAMGRPHEARQNFTLRHKTYRYHDGRFYRPVWFGLFDVAIRVPPIGAIVTVLPVGHRTIIVGGITYYHYDNIYFAACPSGYIVVPEPVVNSNVLVVSPSVGQPQIISGETVTINVPNSNGSYTPVTLMKQKDGYIGPQGEYYAGNPTLEQLKVLYGK